MAPVRARRTHAAGRPRGASPPARHRRLEPLCSRWRCSPAQRRTPRRLRTAGRPTRAVWHVARQGRVQPGGGAPRSRAPAAAVPREPRWLLHVAANTHSEQLLPAGSGRRTGPARPTPGRTRARAHARVCACRWRWRRPPAPASAAPRTTVSLLRRALSPPPRLIRSRQPLRRRARVARRASSSPAAQPRCAPCGIPRLRT